jgi:hypothetical protein
VDIPTELLQHEIAIEPYLGAAGDGSEAFGPLVRVAAFVDEKVRKVLSTATGEAVVSDATAYTALDTVCPASSRVTLPSGRRTRVIAALRRDGGDLPVPSHLEIVCGGDT